MNHLLSRAAEMAAHAVRRQGEWILFEQGQQQVRLKAIAAKPQGIIDDPRQTARLEHRNLKWTVLSADLGRIEPQPGAKITRLDPPWAAETYEVTPEPGQQCFARMDPEGVLISIHSKRIAAS